MGQGQAGAAGYVPDRGLPGGYQPEVEEYPAMMSSKKVTTDARFRDDDGLWAGESRTGAASASMDTEPWRHTSRPPTCSADPPRFDSDYNQAPRLPDYSASGLHSPQAGRAAAAGSALGSFSEAGCDRLPSRQSSMDRGAGYSQHDVLGELPSRARPDLEPGRPYVASQHGTRCSSYMSEYDAASQLGVPAPPHLGVPSPSRSPVEAPHSRPSRCHSHMSSAPSEMLGAGDYGPPTDSYSPSAATTLDEQRYASAAPYRGPAASAGACGNIGTTMPPPGAAASQHAQSAKDAEEARAREAWVEGSVLEIFSSTAGCWNVARLVEIRQEGREDVLTARFYVDEEPKQKSLYRHDTQLARLGANTAGDLPPGFAVKPSQSRPGQLVYLDATTGTKYGSAELAWSVHFDRLEQQPAAGLETVCAIPKRKPASSGTLSSTPSQHAGGSPLCGSPHASAPSASASPANARAISLAELRESGPGGGASPAGPSVLAAAEERLSMANGSKVALPAFGGAADSQSAYLGYVGALGLKDAVAVPAADRPRQTWQPPKQSFTPAARAWQEDAFSQWRSQ